MFTPEELQFLIASVDSKPVSTTQEARNKAHMLIKLCQCLDEPNKPEEEETSEG